MEKRQDQFLKLISKNEKIIANFIYEINKSNWVVGGHDISDGGVLLATAEICIKNKIGFEFSSQDVNWLFGENQGLYLIICNKKNQLQIENKAKVNMVKLQTLGFFNENIFKIGKESIDISELITIYEEGLNDYIN